MPSCAKYRDRVGAPLAYGLVPLAYGFAAYPPEAGDAPGTEFPDDGGGGPAAPGPARVTFPYFLWRLTSEELE